MLLPILTLVKISFLGSYRGTIKVGKMGPLMNDHSEK